MMKNIYNHHYIFLLTLLSVPAVFMLSSISSGEDMKSISQQRKEKLEFHLKNDPVLKQNYRRAENLIHEGKYEEGKTIALECVPTALQMINPDEHLFDLYYVFYTYGEKSEHSEDREAEAKKIQDLRLKTKDPLSEMYIHKKLVEMYAKRGYAYQDVNEEDSKKYKEIYDFLNDRIYEINQHMPPDRAKPHIQKVVDEAVVQIGSLQDKWVLNDLHKIIAQIYDSIDMKEQADSFASQFIHPGTMSSFKMSRVGRCFKNERYTEIPPILDSLEVPYRGAISLCNMSGNYYSSHIESPLKHRWYCMQKVLFDLALKQARRIDDSPYLRAYALYYIGKSMKSPTCGNRDAVLKEAIRVAETIPDEDERESLVLGCMLEMHKPGKDENSPENGYYFETEKRNLQLLDQYRSDARGKMAELKHLMNFIGFYAEYGEDEKAQMLLDELTEVISECKYTSQLRQVADMTLCYGRYDETIALMRIIEPNEFRDEGYVLFATALMLSDNFKEAKRMANEITDSELKKKTETMISERQKSNTFRIWTSSDGKQTVKAKLISVVDGKAVLENESGKRATMETEKLSESDRKYLEQIKIGGHSVP